MKAFKSFRKKLERSESESLDSTVEFRAVFGVSCVFPEGGYEVIVSEFPFGVDKRWQGHRGVGHSLWVGLQLSCGGRKSRN